MSWTPPESGSPLVNCSLEPRQGVRFDLCVTDRHIPYSRVKTFAVSDPLETVTVDRASVVHVVLKKRSPWLLRLVGVLLIAGTTAAVIGFMVGSLDEFHFELLLGYVFGGACFLGGSNRWQLSFSDGKKTHRLIQPVASDKRIMNTMAAALQEAGRLLSGGEAPLRSSGS